MSILDEYSEIEQPKNDLEEKRESLSTLAVLGTTKTYLGKELSLGDITKLKAADVEKYYLRYQKILGKETAEIFLDNALGLMVRGISYFLPIDDSTELCKDLQNNTLLKRELSTAAGFLVLKGGRTVALATRFNKYS